MNRYFFLSSGYVLNEYHTIENRSLQPQSFLKKTFIIIAILAQKTMCWQLNKVIPSGMYNCRFQAISKVLNERMKKAKIKYEPFIYSVIIYLMIWITFRKELVMLATVTFRVFYVHFFMFMFSGLS